MALNTKVKPKFKTINGHIRCAGGKLIQGSFLLGAADAGSAVYKAHFGKITAYIFTACNHSVVELVYDKKPFAR